MFAHGHALRDGAAITREALLASKVCVPALVGLDETAKEAAEAPVRYVILGARLVALCAKPYGVAGRPTPFYEFAAEVWGSHLL